jgi:hypothetical protein
MNCGIFSSTDVATSDVVLDAHLTAQDTELLARLSTASRRARCVWLGTAKRD